jgi:hypothetical protein
LCFSCDGGLTNWDPTDDPWTEHAKWFDKCPYLNLKKSKTFIEYAGRDQSQPLGSNNTDISFTNLPQFSEVPTNNSLLVQEPIVTATETTTATATAKAKPTTTAETKIEKLKFPDSVAKLPDSGYSSPENSDDDSKKSLNSKKLIEENERLKDEQSCRVCYNEESNILFLPCRHLVTCPTCAASVANCPVCRSPIEQTVQVFKS